MYQRGIVSEIDPATGRVRCRLPDRDEVQTYWLEVAQARGHGDRSYKLPQVGEHVALTMDDRMEAGCVIGAVYSQERPPPADSQDLTRWQAEDGTIVTYDKAASRLTFDLRGSAGTIDILTGSTRVLIEPGKITLIADRIDLNP